MVHVRHADALRLVRHGVLRLLLRADEEDRSVALADIASKVVRLLQQLLRLREVDDVDATALGEDEAAHLRVPAACLVAEMNPGLQQLSHGDDSHVGAPSVWLCSVQPAGPRAHRTQRQASAPGQSPPGSGTFGAESVAAMRLWAGAGPARARASAPSSSGGSGDSTSTEWPLNGCGNASRAAWRNWRSRPRSRRFPYSGSPATGRSIAPRWTRI